MIRSLFDKVRAVRGYLTLMALAVSAAFLYAQFQEVRSDRDALASWGEAACAAAGSHLVTPENPTQPEPMRRGVACRAKIDALAAFKSQSATKTADELLAALDERLGKENVDAALARRAAERAQLAAAQMEAANAAVEGDRVGHAWFDALNRSGGLRSPNP